MPSLLIRKPDQIGVETHINSSYLRLASKECSGDLKQHSLDWSDSPFCKNIGSTVSHSTMSKTEAERCRVMIGMIRHTS